MVRVRRGRSPVAGGSVPAGHVRRERAPEASCFGASAPERHGIKL